MISSIGKFRKYWKIQKTKNLFSSSSNSKEFKEKINPKKVTGFNLITEERSYSIYNLKLLLRLFRYLIYFYAEVCS